MPAHTCTARYHCVYFMLLCAVLLLLIPDLPALAATVMALSLNEGAGPTFTDTSGQVNNGSCSGAACPTAASGAVGTASLFDGVGDSITVPGSGSLKPPSTFALSVYVKTASATAQEVVSMGDNYGLRITADGNVRFSYHTGNLNWTVVNTTGVNVLDNTFHHLVGQRTASNTLEIYVDGVQRGFLSGATLPIAYTLGPNLMIGRHSNGGTNFFNGTIDQVAIYNTSLSPVEIAARMTLKLNEAAGAVTFTDASIGNTGSCSGTTCPQSGVAGAVNTAAAFDGSTDFINVPGNATLRPTSTVAVSAHIKTSTVPPNGGEIISMGDNYTLRILANGNLRFFFYLGNNTWTTLDTTVLNLKDSIFHHVVGQKTPTHLEIYVDGVMRGQMPATGTIAYGLGTNLNVGRHANNDPTRYFNGTIDEVNVFSRSLTSAEIGSLSAGGGVPLRTDKDAQIIQSTSLIPAAKGVKFSDPNFPGVQLMRVTNETDGSIECKHEYSYVPAMNSNNTRILFVCNSGNGNKVYVRTFDPNTHALDPGKTELPISFESVLWSPVNPNILVHHTGPQLRWWDVSAGGGNLERDFNAETNGQSIFQVSRSEDNAVWAFMKGPSLGNYTGYIVWRRAMLPTDPPLGQILLNVTWTENSRVDEVKIDKSGTYLTVHLDYKCPTPSSCPLPGNIGTKVTNLQTGATTGIVKDTTQKDPGHYDVGIGTMVGTGDCCNVLTYRQLDTAAHIQGPSNIINYGSEWNNCRGVPARSTHLSMVATNDDWALVSTYDDTGRPCGSPPQPFLREANEIFQVSTDGLQNVRRIAHHHSYYVNYEYWSLPKASISKDGKFVIWTSNWHGTRKDVYMAIIPPAP
jgi:hypothetical protein